MSYVTAFRNGDYGIYGFDSINGTIEHSYASGSPDAGVYIGQCFPCDSVIDDVISEHNGLGYSGTDSGGNLYIVNPTFRNNRAGIVPNSGSYELCYPERQTTIVGNIVYSNNQPDTPAIDVAILAMGNGILVPGGIGNVIERNLRVRPRQDRHRPRPVPRVRAERRPAEPRTSGTAVFGDAQQAARRSRHARADLLDAAGQLGRRQRRRRQRRRRPRVSAVATDLSIIDPTGLGNCFAGNTFTTTAPADIEALRRVRATGAAATTWRPISTWRAGSPTSRRRRRRSTTRPPDARAAGARGHGRRGEGAGEAGRNMPPPVDIAAITVPDKPAS